jgi:hypothetical protein
VTNSSELSSAASNGPAGDQGNLTLTLVTTACGSTTCPSVYRSDRGTLVIQGYAVDATNAGVELPAGELLVEIPVELLATAARSLS